MIYIYTLSDIKGNLYVGKTSDLEQRYKTHLKECKKKRTIKEKWIFSLLSNNEKPIIEILEECNEDNWEQYEIYWIGQLKAWGFRLMNGTSGGEGSDGFRGKKHSLETKLKCKESQSKRKHPGQFGEKHPRSKLKNIDVLNIRQMINDNIKVSIISKKYNVTRHTINNIKNKKFWKNL